MVATLVSILGTNNLMGFHDTVIEYVVYGKACFTLAGIDGDGLLQAVELSCDMVKNGDNGIPVPNYTDEIVSTKVVKIIQSYTGVVNKMVWRKI